MNPILLASTLTLTTYSFRVITGALVPLCKAHFLPRMGDIVAGDLHDCRQGTLHARLTRL
jgi:hypothetical protein